MWFCRCIEWQLIRHVIKTTDSCYWLIHIKNRSRYGFTVHFILNVFDCVNTCYSPHRCTTFWKVWLSTTRFGWLSRTWLVPENSEFQTKHYEWFFAVYIALNLSISFKLLNGILIWNWNVKKISYFIFFRWKKNPCKECKTWGGVKKTERSVHANFLNPLGWVLDSFSIA